MNARNELSPLARLVRGIVLAFIVAAAPTTHADPTFWTGTETNYNQATSPDGQDFITPEVALRRDYGAYIYNLAAGEMSVNASVSPVDTEWATATPEVIADLTTAPSLTYTTFTDWANGPTVNPGARTFNRIVNLPAVLHLIDEDIYISIKFTYWGSQGQGLTATPVAYTRSTPAAAQPPPTVTITNPASNAVFAAPANVTIGASASVDSGSVTNVAFFANASPLGSSQISPYSIASGGLNAGSYALTAVATAGGVSSTSPPVNITVISAAPVSISAPKITNGQFSFNYSADIGLSYVVQRSTPLGTNWSGVITNVATSNSVHFTDPFVPGGSRYYRVGRMPNP